MLKTDLTSELLTISEAKAYLKCSHVFIWKRRKEGKIKTLGLGRKILIPKSSLDAFIGLKKEELV